MNVGDEIVELAYPNGSVSRYRVTRIGLKSIDAESSGVKFRLNLSDEILVVVTETTKPLIMKVEDAEKALEAAIEELRKFQEGA